MVKRKLRNFTVFVVFAICAALFSACDTGGNAVSERRITFHLNGGTGTAPSAITQRPGLPVELPTGSGFSHSGYGFGGWVTRPDGAGRFYAARHVKTMPSANMRLYAQWVSGGDDGTIVPGNTLAQQLDWLRSNAQSNGNYVIDVSQVETIGPQQLRFVDDRTGSVRTNITITLRALGGMQHNINFSSHHFS